MNKKEIQVLKDHLNNILKNSSGQNLNKQTGFIWQENISDLEDVVLNLSYSDVRFILDCIEFRESKQDYNII